MDGVTILNKTVVTEIPSWAIFVFVGGLILIIVGLVLASCAISEIEEITSVVMACIGFFGFIAIGFIQPEVETGRYRYEVIMDESVQFTDIYEKYEVIEQRGEIWVLEDKEK